MAAKKVSDMNCHAMTQFARVLDKAGFTPELIKKIIKSKGNGFAKEMFKVANAFDELASYFLEVGEFTLFVPENYDHATRLETFKKECADKFYIFEEQLRDRWFEKVSHKMAPGERYLVKVFEIQEEEITLEEKLSFLKKIGATLAGAQGLTLAWELQKRELSKFCGQRAIKSLDEKDAAFNHSGHAEMLMIRDCGVDEWRCDMTSLTINDFDCGTYILGFIKI